MDNETYYLNYIQKKYNKPISSLTPKERIDEHILLDTNAEIAKKASHACYEQIFACEYASAKKSLTTLKDLGHDILQKKFIDHCTIARHNNDEWRQFLAECRDEGLIHSIK